MRMSHAFVLWSTFTFSMAWPVPHPRQHVARMCAGDSWSGMSDDLSYASADELLGFGMSEVGDRAAPSEAGLADLSELLAEWQEQAAIADEGDASSGQQEAMMVRWRQMVVARESELRSRQQKRSKAGGSSWVPAFLTGWQESGASGGGAARVSSELAALEAFAAETLTERADEADDAFVLAWQRQAERARSQLAATPTAERAPPTSLGSSVARWASSALRRDDAEYVAQGQGAHAADGTPAAIGIDLGTSNSAVAYVRAGRPVVVKARDGLTVSPSVVSYVSTARRGAREAGVDELPRPLLAPDAVRLGVLCGEAARRQWISNPHSTYASTKRLIGRTATAAELRRLGALDVSHRGTSRGVLLACPALRRAISAVDVGAELVRELLATAAGELAYRPTRAVVTVPAYFDEAQRAATTTACLLAGLDEVSLLREPEAAALSWALDLGEREERLMVFDLGGGTFDVSILDVGAGVIEVIATSGDPRLGGDDWDRLIAGWLEDQFVSEHGRSLDGMGRRRLLDAAVKWRAL